MSARTAVWGTVTSWAATVALIFLLPYLPGQLHLWKFAAFAGVLSVMAFGVAAHVLMRKEGAESRQSRAVTVLVACLSLTAFVLGWTLNLLS